MSLQAMPAVIDEPDSESVLEMKVVELLQPGTVGSGIEGEDPARAAISGEKQKRDLGVKATASLFEVDKRANDEAERRATAGGDERVSQLEAEGRATARDDERVSQLEREWRAGLDKALFKFRDSQGTSHPADGQESFQESYNRVKGLVLDLYDAKINSISVLHATSYSVPGASLSDNLKLWLERSTGEEWDWWPLRKPLHSTRHLSESRSLGVLQWKCVS
jgi:hypothetical protein